MHLLWPSYERNSMKIWIFLQGNWKDKPTKQDKPLSSPVAEADSSRWQPSLFPFWFWVRLVDGQDFCEKCRFQWASAQRSSAAHPPAGWSFCSVTAAQHTHGASTVQGNWENTQLTQVVLFSNCWFFLSLKNNEPECFSVYIVEKYFKLLNSTEASKQMTLLMNNSVPNRVPSFP